MLVPFITSTVMFGIKRLAGLNLIGNAQNQKPWLRAILLTLSLCGVVATNFLNGTPVDASQVSSVITALLQALPVAYFAHAFYNSAFARSQ